MTDILIVDDNPDIAFMLQEKIRFYIGGTVRVAHSGESCLEMIRNARPDLILLDICMPGTDGFEVCRLLKADRETAGAPVVFLSATYNDLRSRVKGLDLGADDYMVHPMDDLELVTRVKAVLRIKELRDQLAAARDSLDALHERHAQMRSGLASCCAKTLSFCQDEPGRKVSSAELAREARELLALVDGDAGRDDASPARDDGKIQRAETDQPRR